ADGSSTSTITVQLKDQYGNDLSSSGGTVALSTTAGSLSGVTDVGDGTSTATLTSSTTSGTATVTGTLDSAAIADDASVAFVAGPATKLAITTQPVGGASGSLLATQPVVVVQDANGNTVTTDSTTQIAVAIQSGTGGSLGGTTTITVSGGVATFTNLALTGTAGVDYVLRFTASPGLTSVDSSNLQVTGPTACGSFVLGSTLREVTAGGAVSAVAVSTDANCAWTAVSSQPWLVVTSGASGTGDGEVSFSVAANGTNANRTATITVTNALSSEVLTVNQSRQSLPAAWGLAKYGLNSIPASIGLSTVSMVAANRRDNIAVLQDGTVAVWGFGGDGQDDVPATLLDPTTANVIQVSAGPRHMAALQSDGTVVCWGRNFDGECNVPVGLVAISVSAGRAHTLAVRSDGTVAAWGRNQVGQCHVPAGLSNVIAVAAGDWHSVALKSDGTVVAWGDNSFGQTNVPASLANPGATVAKIAAGRNHTLALRSDRTIEAWGDNRQGQCTVRADLQSPATANVIAISGGRTSSAILQADGTIVYLGITPFGSGTTPAGLGLPTGIAAGDDVTIVIVPPSTAPPNNAGGALGGGSVGATLLVPEQFATIGEAVAAAGSESTILVGPGVYRERIDLGDRGLQLVSIGGAGETVLDARGHEGSAITITPAGDATTGLVTRVVGFTIRGGEAELGGGVRIDRAVAEIVECHVLENGAGSGGGVAVSFGDLLVEDCLVEGNWAQALGGGLHAAASSVMLSNSAIVGNLAGDAGGGVWADAESIVLGEALRLCGNLPNEAAFEGDAFEMPPHPCPVRGDLDGDGVVGPDDLSRLLAAWGMCEQCEADLDGDGEVDGSDLVLLMAAWMAAAGGGA
ncbi:MAG: invasin domain 3-containing protein, partial [Phycisphaerales bacterium]